MNSKKITIDNFKDKVVVVMGGSSGIGRACVEAFSNSGAHVAIGSLDKMRGQTAAKEISSRTGRTIIAIPTDIRIVKDCYEIMDQVKQKFGYIDILINSAAYFAKQPALTFSRSKWRRMFQTNVDGAFFCSVAFALHVIERGVGGSIVNISSTSSALSAAGYSAYCATKAALDGLTRSLAVEWASYNIRVNSVAPAHTNTAGIQSALQDGELDYDAITRVIPLRRIAELDEVSSAVLFLSSKEASFITGQTLFVDGGRTVNGNWESS